MSRPAERPLLPQTSATNFQFATPELGAGYNKKNYVFVDEHNRHKRLKVMRACEGCRRRKIKCDAATTNTWPCAACVRLKLQCVPPSVNYARSNSDANASGLERVMDFDSSDASGDEGYMPQPQMTGYSMSGQMGDFTSGSPYHQLHTRPSMPHIRHRSSTSVSLSANDTNFHTSQSYRPIPSSHPIQLPQRQDTWPPAAPAATSPPASNLSEALGDLKLDEAGVAPYIIGQKKKLAEAPALEEQELVIPMRPGGTVRIPQELMPNDLVAQEYFEIFFREIHPYIPVISKSYFYSQWSNNRGSISPLLLEAIFACAGRLSDSDPASGASWLALAAKHEPCFMDVPRLSTLQALIILMKAKEHTPKRGYYYRSWMSVKAMVEMAKDLELDQHYAEHKSGQRCSADPTHCVVKTRIWQSIFIIEQMIGGPQARYDYSTSLDTVDFDVPAPNQAIDHEESEVTYNYTYMARCVRNVRFLTDAYAPIRKKANWAADAAFVALNAQIPKFQEELPTTLQIQYPADGSAPWIPDHFTANMHCYYHLSVLLLRRPQLMKAAANSANSKREFTQQLSVCYETAKMMCKIQESLYQNYGMNGLMSMVRGINFTVYCILACVVVHLVALTSPVPEFNSEARDYFTRHMRLLESCMNAAPMKDIQEQIQSLREAFSVDTGKPFELRPDIASQNHLIQQHMVGSPMNSPVDQNPHGFQQPQLRLQISQAQPQQILAVHSLPVTPISNHTDDLKDGGALAAASLTMMAASAHPNSGQVLPHQQLSPPDTVGGYYGTDATSFENVDAATSNHDDGVAWNPTPIFDQWQAAFGTPASSVANSFPNPNGMTEQHSPTLYSQTGSTAGHEHDPTAQYNTMAVPSVPTTGVTGAPNYQSANHNFVSPNMWQQAVGEAFNSNPLKRGWED